MFEGNGCQKLELFKYKKDTNSTATMITNMQGSDIKQAQRDYFVLSRMKNPNNHVKFQTYQSNPFHTP